MINQKNLAKKKSEQQKLLNNSPQLAAITDGTINATPQIENLPQLVQDGLPK